MATFEDLRKANEAIRTMGIERTDRKTGETKVTQYAEVNQRIKAFRMVYPEGTIETEMLSNQNGVCIFRAVVKNIDIVLGTGTAYEKETSSFINKTSYIENCETSAVGRALGMAGFGIDVSVASYEEVANAMEQQKASIKYATAGQIAMIRRECSEDQIKKLLEQKKVSKLEELTDEQAASICIKLNERKVKEMESK